MVAHIHGGGFGGGANDADMSSLVSQGLVVVNIAYRLGPYGLKLANHITVTGVSKIN